LQESINVKNAIILYIQSKEFFDFFRAPPTRVYALGCKGLIVVVSYFN